MALATADDAVAAQPASLILSAIYWRNTWKYQARGYRHLFWDSGTLLGQLLAVARVLDVPARLVTGFVEVELNGLLGLDAEKEGALVAVPLGAPGPGAAASPVITTLAPEIIALSSREVDYPVLRDAYDNSSLDSEAEVTDWREPGGGQVLNSDISPASPRAGVVIQDLTPLPAPLAVAGRSLGETIAKRGSTREFSGEAITAEALSSALFHATRGFPADVPSGLVDLYVNVHAVTGIEPGAYAYDRGAHALARLRAGDVREASAFLCLEQALGGTSSATVFFLADLTRVLERWGNRGYRLVNLEAGLIGGRLYLGAYGQRFGASGLTFYDRAVVEFFSPHAAGKDAIFVTALGRSAKSPLALEVRQQAPAGDRPDPAGEGDRRREPGPDGRAGAHVPADDGPERPPMERGGVQQRHRDQDQLEPEGRVHRELGGVGREHHEAGRRHEGEARARPRQQMRRQAAHRE